MAKKRKPTVPKLTEAEKKIPLCVCTNEPNPMKSNMLLMLYKAAGMAQLGYMDGLDPETGETHPLLVGLDPTADGQFRAYPLARLFTKLDEIPEYLIPDGKGNYLDFRQDKNDIPEFTTASEESGTSEEGPSLTSTGD